MKKILAIGLSLLAFNASAMSEDLINQIEEMRKINPALDKVMQEREERAKNRLVILTDEEYQKMNPFKGKVQTYNSGQHADFIRSIVNRKGIWGSTLQSNIKNRNITVLANANTGTVEDGKYTGQTQFFLDENLGPCEYIYDTFEQYFFHENAVTYEMHGNPTLTNINGAVYSVDWATQEYAYTLSCVPESPNASTMQDLINLALTL
jgi:hypothetical protein